MCEFFIDFFHHIYGLGEDITGSLDDDNLSANFPNRTDVETVTGEWTFSKHPLGLDHGSIGGLADDDHTQYRLESEDHSHQSTGAQAGQLDHGLAMTAASLLDDDHTQYRLESADHSHQSAGAQAGQLDHGLALTGLADDDHPQYRRFWRTFLLMGA